MNWDMLGHEWAVNLLKGHIANDRVRHAYLITGARGIGRRTLALRLAQAINCTSPVSTAEPCLACQSCDKFGRMQHPDLSLVAAERVGGVLKVNQIRELQRSLALTPYEARYRVAILMRFEEANPNASNALLKTLEEPAPQVVLIVTAESAERLLPTIVSRCEVIRLRSLPFEQVSDGLQKHWDVPQENAKLLAHISGGRPGYALALHRESQYMAQRQTWLDEHARLLAANRVDRFAYAGSLDRNKDTLLDLLSVWLSLWRDVLLRAAGANVPITNLDCSEEVDRLASRFNMGVCRKTIAKLESTLSMLESNVNPRLAVEVLLLDLPSADQIIS